MFAATPSASAGSASGNEAPPNRWLRLTLALGAILLLGFGVSLLISSQSILGDANRRNAANLAVIANGLETWPRTIAEIARANSKTVDIDHPQLGRITVTYDNCRSETPPATTPFPRSDRPGAGPQLELADRFSESGQTNPQCYSASLPLEAILAVGQTVPSFSNLLIVGPDKAVLEQFGPTSLPIAKLGEISPSSNLAKDISNNLTSAQPPTPANDVAALETAPGAARLKIANDIFYAYIRPVRIDGSARPCPAAGSSTSSPGGAVVPRTPPPDPNAGHTDGGRAKGYSCQYFLVGLMRADALQQEALTPPYLILTIFALLVLIVIALLPVARLLLIGNSESVSQIEVGAMAFGVFAAAAIATIGWLYAFEIIGERRLADIEARRLSSRLAVSASTEFQSRLANAIHAQFAKPVDGKCDGASSSNNAPGSDRSLPRIYEAGLFRPDGTFCRDAATGVAARQPMPHGTQIGARPYFLKLKQSGAASFAGHHYSVSQIRAQTDGINKTVVAIADEPQGRVFVYTTILKSLISPILPPPQHFMVIDTSEEALPILFHSQAGRAGFSSLANEMKSPESIVAGIRDLEDSYQFTRRYDGRITRFAATRIKGTPWAVLVYYPLNSVDRIASGTALRAMTAWAGFSFTAVVICTLLLMLQNKIIWLYLWPFHAAEAFYDRAKWLGFAAFPIAALGFWPSNWGPPLAVLSSTALAFIAYFRLRRLQLNAKPMTARGERDYRQFVLAIIAVIAIAPMIVFWADARSLSREITDLARHDRAVASVTQRGADITALQSSLRSAQPGSFDPLAPWGGPFERIRIDRRQLNSFSRILMNMQDGFREARSEHCLPSDARYWYCWRLDRERGVSARIAVSQRDLLWPGHSPALSALLLLAIILLGLMIWMVIQGLEALTGFGIPLGAVAWPRLVLGNIPPESSKNELKLSSKSLLVAPQQAIRDRISDPDIAVTINLADKLMPLSDTKLAAQAEDGVATQAPWPRLKNDQPARLVLAGLELVLRDPLRRRAALDYLEKAVAALEEQAHGSPAALVIIAEMSPLERILDAFDMGDDDKDRLSTREELRWARLFQDFTTFSFQPIDKVSAAIRNAFLSDEGKPTDGGPRITDFAPPAIDSIRDPKSPGRVLIEELRWLPGNVIDSIIADHDSRSLFRYKGDRFPLADSDYQEYYTPKLIRWALRVNPISKEAAIDYLRANLIEHYEQCWEASSLAERFILDAIAHGSHVNMSRAVALQSLVRRGLVILDPAPRLMNHSFGMFIRQTERPGTLTDWRAKQPPSGWSLAKKPLVVLIPLLVIGLAIAAVQAGLELTALLSMLAATTPALLGMIARGIRGS